jgi:hypothetical protein
LGRCTGFGEDAVVHAIDSRVRHQRVFRQVIEQHVEAEDVIGHQQLGGRRRGLRGQALTQCVGLIMHGLLELQAHDHGVNHQCQGDQNHVMAGNTQSQRNAAIAQGPEDQQEEVIGFDRRWPVH